jgi:hypothetical protein
VSGLRHLIPRVVRHGVSTQLARARARRLEGRLEQLTSGSHAIVAGPWLGEVGFELLYWVPFLAWFSERFKVAPERLHVVSRGGVASWYQPFAGHYHEIFSSLTPTAFHALHEQRVTALGEQKQRQVLAFEHDLLRTLVDDVRNRRMLHPSTMYELYKTYWWGHAGTDWVHQRARYHALAAPRLLAALPAGPYTAVKFYFNDCFPPTETNRAFVRRLLEQLVARGPVVSLTTGLRLDDHGDCPVETFGVQSLPHDLPPADNLGVQSAIVAGATAFVGTYGGFSYLAPFHGVPATAYYSHAGGFSPSHLTMARSALARLHGEKLLDVRTVAGSTTGDPHRPADHRDTETQRSGTGTQNPEPGTLNRTANLELRTER